MPLSAVRRFLKPPDPAKIPDFPRSKLIVQTVVTLAFLGILAIFYARAVGVDLFAHWRFNLISVLAGIGTLVLVIAARKMLYKWLIADPRRKPSKIIPKTWDELPSWIIVSASAGFWEELVYRGTLYKFVAYYANSFTIAFVVSCLAFAAVHLYQGVRGFLFILGLAVVIQWLVNFTGTLYIAMAAHFIYDVIVGILKILEEKKGLIDAPT